MPGAFAPFTDEGDPRHECLCFRLQVGGDARALSRHLPPAAVVAHELGVNAADRPTRRLVQELIAPMERSGRCVTPTFADWTEAAAILSEIAGRDRGWRSKLPALRNDILIALCARRIGATLFTFNGKDFRLIRRHKEFALRVLAAEPAS